MVTKKDRPMNGAERRQVNRVLARAVALEIIRDANTKLCHLDHTLMPTNRVMERWAVGSGDGMPSDEWDDSRKSSRMPPLDDYTHIIVDQAIMRAPSQHSLLVRQWYWGSGSTTTIAQRLGLSRCDLYVAWRNSLLYFRETFRASGHRDLINLLERLD